MNAYTSPADAISASIAHDQITFLADSQENRGFLRAECDDYVDTDDVIEYWGETDDGEEWRVHIRIEPRFAYQYSESWGDDAQVIGQVDTIDELPEFVRAEVRDNPDMDTWQAPIPDTDGLFLVVNRVSA